MFMQSVQFQNLLTIKTQIQKTELKWKMQIFDVVFETETLKVSLKLDLWIWCWFEESFVDFESLSLRLKF